MYINKLTAKIVMKKKYQNIKIQHKISTNETYKMKLCKIHKDNKDTVFYCIIYKIPVSETGNDSTDAEDDGAWHLRAQHLKGCQINNNFYKCK